MGKNKLIVSILCLLFVLTFSAGVVGYLNKDNTKPVTPNVPNDTPVVPDNKPVSENAVVVEYTGEAKTLENLESFVGGYEFVKANKENVYGDVRAYIDNGAVKVEVSSSVTNEDGTTTTDMQNYDITDVTNPVAVHVQALGNEENLVKVYILDSQNRLFCATFNGNKDSYTGISLYHYNIANIESFVSLNIPLPGSEQADALRVAGYVIIKTTDGKYYTDYNYTNSESVVLTELSATAPAAQAVDVVETKLNDKKENIKNAALLYVKSNELLKEDGQVNIYVYKLIEEGLLQVDAEAVSEKCVQSKNNTSMGCILDPTDETKTLNPDYIMVSKVGTDYTAEYVVSK